MKSALVVTRDALYEAVATGHIPTIDAYFAQDSVQAEVEQTNAHILMHASSDALPLLPWFHKTANTPAAFGLFHTHCFLFGIAIANDQIAVLQWFFSSERVTLMAATLAFVLSDIGYCAMVTDSCGSEVFEIVLSSAVFLEILTTAEQEQMLRKLLYRQHWPCVALREQLIAHGARVNSADDECNTATPDLTVELVNLLVRNGLIVVGVDMLSPALSYNSSCRLMRHLLALGAVGSNYRAMLCVAASRCRMDIVQLLLESAFVDVGIRDDGDPIANVLFLTPRCLAKAEPIVKLLLENGIDTELQTERGRTFLHQAVSQGHIGVTKLLLHHGADPNARDSNGAVPLDSVDVQCLHDRRHMKQLQLLLQHGADPSANGKDEISTRERLVRTGPGRAFMDQYPQFFSTMSSG